MGDSTFVQNHLKSLEENSELDHYNVSIKAISQQTTSLLSALLNPLKVFFSDSTLPRDWHGLAQLVGIGAEQIPNLECGDATNKILRWWYQHDKGATIKNLILYLDHIDRFDIIDDLTPFLDEDIKVFQQTSEACVPVSINSNADNYILTTDDVKNIRAGLALQKYDAFVLFSNDDINFAEELIDILENHYNLKLCVKDRDLVAGAFEHNSIIRLISERCNRLIAILTPAFLESSFNKFICSFAQSLGIEQDSRKIIPCVYTPCTIPLEIRCYFKLYYQQAGLGRNFWEKLTESIITTSSGPSQNQNICRSASQKMPSTSQTNDIKQSLQDENNCLLQQKDLVKISSMVNMSYTGNDNTMHVDNLNASTSVNGLTTSTTIQNEKNKRNTKWFKNLWPRKHRKFSDNVIRGVPEPRKKKRWL